MLEKLFQSILATNRCQRLHLFHNIQYCKVIKQEQKSIAALYYSRKVRRHRVQTVSSGFQLFMPLSVLCVYRLIVMISEFRI